MHRLVALLIRCVTYVRGCERECMVKNIRYLGVSILFMSTLLMFLSISYVHGLGACVRYKG